MRTGSSGIWPLPPIALLEIDGRSYLRLTPQLCNQLTAHFNIYLAPDGRINIAGLNDPCIKRVARCIDIIVRDNLNNIPEEACETLESLI